jgi:hypothetical protein
MMVVCRTNKMFPTLLTVGKEYKVVKETWSSYIIVNDRGQQSWHGKNAFEPVF